MKKFILFLFVAQLFASEITTERMTRPTIGIWPYSDYKEEQITKTNSIITDLDTVYKITTGLFEDSLYKRAIRVNKFTIDTAWEDLRFSVLSLRVGPTADPDFTQLRDDSSSSTGVFAYDFDASTEEQSHGNAQLPHAWEPGTVIKPHVHGTVKSTEIAQVCWGLEYVVLTSDTIPFTTIIYIDTVTTGNDTLYAYKEYIWAFPTIDMSGYSESANISFRIFRDADADGGTDDYTADATLIEFDIHYIKNKLGTENELPD